MAKKTTGGIDPDKTYKVKLKRPIIVGRSKLRPADGLKIKGVHLEANMDAVEAYEEA